MGAPDQPRDDHGRWTSGGSVGDHQASQSKPVGPGRQPTTEHRLTQARKALHALGGAPETEHALAQARKAAHDAGMNARLEAYAQAHGGKQAPNASGAAASWRPSSVSHAGQRSVGTGGGSSGGGGSGGGSGGGDRGGGGGGRLSAAARDRIIRNKGIDARHGLLPGTRGPDNQSQARDMGMRGPPNAADFAMSALRRRR